MKEYWLAVINKEGKEKWLERKLELSKKREAEIVRYKLKGAKFRQHAYDGMREVHYLLKAHFLMKQKGSFYIEENIIPYVLQEKDGRKIHRLIEKQKLALKDIELERGKEMKANEFARAYDRRAAVGYANRWWNDYNPAYPSFDNDCTNYVSQCLRAGGAPMTGMPKGEVGWWYERDKWSYSWSVAHSLRWYLSGAESGLIGVEVDVAEKLLPGDVICYDFEGDNRWDHTTIVVAKDAEGMPLVNAHTNSSRNRYWSYEDSLAWTPNIKYKFFTIKIV